MQVLFAAAAAILILILVARPKGTPTKKAKPLAGRGQRPISHPIDVDALVKRSLHFEIDTGYKENDEDSAFEARIAEQFGPQIDKHFYARVAGVSFANRDGSSREVLIQQCKSFDELKLVREKDNPFDSGAVMVLNAAGQQLGYLHREQAVQVASSLDGSADSWGAVVRKVTPRFGEIPSGLIICLFRAALVAQAK